MARTDLHLKLELSHNEEEDPKRLADEISRQLLKVYGVRRVEVSNIVADPH